MSGRRWPSSLPSSASRAGWAAKKPAGIRKRGRDEREEREQAAVIAWARLTRMPRAPDIEPRAKIADYLHATPNGGARPMRTARAMKATGTLSGVSDLHLPLARHGCHSLWIEMKAAGGSESANQRAWRNRMMRAGHRAVVCVGGPEAIREICTYLGLKIPEELREREK